MTIKIDKIFFIKLAVVLVLCASCFCLGRFLRFSKISGKSQKLVEGITISQETAEELAQHLNIGGEALKSASSYEKALLEGVDALSKSSDTGLKCVELLNDAFNENQKITEKYLSINTDVIVTELQKAEEQALVYENLFREYKRLMEEK